MERKIECRCCGAMSDFEIGLVVCPKCGVRFTAEQIMAMGEVKEALSTPVPPEAFERSRESESESESEPGEDIGEVRPPPEE
jgi:uncharacterized Zn finger protein (UPF0148 family)